MASYVRQSTFADGDLITAALFNNEYNQLVSAFDNATGHKHDGTVGEGPVISVLGDAGLATPLNKILVDTTNDHIEFYIDVSGTSTQQLYIADGAIVPTTNDDVDLGTSALKFKDLYLSGTANITGNAVVTGNLTVEGTTVTLNTATLDVEDKNITLNYGAGDTSSNADGAGITIQDAVDASTDATILWNATNDRFDFSHAIDVTGSATVDGLTVDGDATISDGNPTLSLVDTTATNQGAEFKHNAGTTTIQSSNTSTHGLIKFNSNNGTDTVTRMQIDRFGDISFYEDTGTTAKLFWDASAERLGIGTSSPQGNLHVEGAAGVSGGGIIYVTDADNGSTASDALQISKSGDTAFIYNRETLGNLQIGAGGNANHMIVRTDGKVGIGTTSPSTTLDVNGTITYGSLSDGTITITGFADEDDMVSNSATLVPTQQSVKAYVDSQVGTVDTLSEILANGNTTGGTDIAFGDNDKAIFGTGSDLSIYHSGTNSHIADTGEGNLYLDATNLIVRNGTGTETYMTAANNGGVVLYHDNTSRFSTTSTGIDVTGTVVSDGIGLAAGSTISSAGGLIVTIDDDNSSGSTYFEINADGTSKSIARFVENGDISFYDDTGSSENLKWDASADTLNFVDNAKATFGASDDLQIYHTGTTSFIANGGNGSLRVTNGASPIELRASTVALQDNSAYNYLRTEDLGNGGRVRIYHEGSQVMMTESSGIDVTGTVTSDGLTVDGTAQISAQTNGAYALRVGDAAGSSGSVAGIGKIGINPQGAGTFTYTGTEIRATENALGDYRARLSFHTRGSTSDVEPLERLRIDQTGDISFYDDTGTTQSFFWDASAERLGIGTTTPSELLHIYNTGGAGNDANVLIEGNGSGVNAKLTIDGHVSGGQLDLTYRSNTQSKTVAMRCLNDGSFRIDTLGSEAMRIVGDNVGIGTSSPNYLLDVEGSGSLLRVNSTSGDSNIDLRVADTTSLNIINFGDSGSSNAGRILYRHSGDSMAFNVAGSEAVRIINGGNVGIGTTSPNASLHITNTAPAIMLTDSDTGADSRISASSGAGSLFIDADLNNEAAFSTMSFRIDGSEAGRFDTSGNLGIGTTNISDKLTVLGATKVIETDSANTSAISLDFSGSLARIRSTINGTGTIRDLGFFMGGSEKARLDTSGNFGIGTSSPNAKLDVSSATGSSSITPTELRISSSTQASDWSLTEPWGVLGFYSADTSGGGAGSLAEISANMENTVGGFASLDFKLQNSGESYAKTSWLTLKNSSSFATRQVLIEADGGLYVEGNVGIGTSSPSLTYGGKGLHIENNDTAGLMLNDTTGAKFNLAARSSDILLYSNTAHPIRVGTNGSERMRIHSSGSVGIGTTAPETPLHVSTAKSSVTDSVLTLQDTTETFGKMIEFVGQGSTDCRGIIGFQEPEDNAPELYIANGGVETSGNGVGLAFWSYISVNRIIPCDNLGALRDDAIDLGSSNARFDDIYATNGTIQTSDRNDKQDIQALTDAETRVATACKGLLRKFRWQNAVTEKGDEARYHFGIISQDLQDAFTAEGLDAGDYGMFISETWEDSNGVEQTRLGVRYSELLAFIIAAI